jgi:hypothetical protein
MANAVRLRVGRWVSYKTAAGKWIPAVITAITSQTAVKLAAPRSTADANYANSPLVGTPGQMVALNGGLDVNKQTAHGQTNVWKPYV